MRLDKIQNGLRCNCEEELAPDYFFSAYTERPQNHPKY